MCDLSDVNDLTTHHTLQSTRRPPMCKRCCTLMYPGPSGAPENHKRGYCSDGVKQTIENAPQNEDPPRANTMASVGPPKWPQPQGLFTAGTYFHPVELLKKIGEMYEKVVIEQSSGEFLMEHEAFASLLARRTLVLEDGSVLFKLFDLECPSSTPDGLIITHEGNKYVQIDCLRESSDRAEGLSI
jgi:hypothetical protein